MVSRSLDPVRSAELAELMARYPDRSAATTYPKEFRVIVDREKARFSTWYEMFPRSCTTDPAHHGTFRDCIDRLDYVAAWDSTFSIFRPFIPSAEKAARGRTIAFRPSPDDTGSPWAIGCGRRRPQIDPSRARNTGGFQAAAKRSLPRAGSKSLSTSPSSARPTIPTSRNTRNGSATARTAPSNTPKIRPKNTRTFIRFISRASMCAALCAELKSVVVYWSEQGVRIFRVDNPHTKPFAFWEWLIEEVRRDYPDVIFLAEAFTRPKVMYRLAKLGFAQSYTYFAWKNTQMRNSRSISPS